jgi:hypothetical protein
MANIVRLFPQQTTASSAHLPQPVRAARPPAAASKPPKYLAQRHGVYYFKRKIPANLVLELANQTQIWKSLNTTDFALACRELAKELAAFELRIATVRLRMASDGILVVPAARTSELRDDMIPALVQRYYIHMLDREEQELHAMRPLCMEDHHC